MVILSDVRESNSSLRTRTSIVAVFAGATSGIGASTLKALALHTSDPKVYIIGRNEARASALIKECLKTCPRGAFVFLKADLSLLRNVDELCEQIKKREETGRLDVLFMSQGYITFEGRKDTDEGLDTLMSLRYYSRMRLLYNLTPLLLHSRSPRVLSIFAAGKEAKFFPADLSLRSHYNTLNSISHVAFMTTFFFESVAAKYPSISCLHVYPGLVKTEEFENGLFPGWVKWWFKWIMLPLITPLCVSVEECGERNLFHCTSAKYPAANPLDSGVTEVEALPGRVEVATGVDGERASGVYAVDWNGEVVKSSEAVYKRWRDDGIRNAVWEHTMKAFEASETRQVFVE